jgi:epoxyqueuosine reductase
MAGLAARLQECGLRAGLAAVGIAPAVPMHATRQVIEERKAAGLSGGMQFTYRNPARSTDPARALPGAAALVVGAWYYGRAQDGVASAKASSPLEGRLAGRVARYAWQDHYASLRTALAEVAAVLQGAGWRAQVVADDNALVDRAAAESAGLGWFGKNSNILLPGRGSWFVLGSVVTDAPLPPDRPVPEGCGPCRRCLRACPTDALVAPGVLDARRCLAWLLQSPGVFPWEHREALGDRIYGCDDCQEVCPVNRLAPRTRRASTMDATTVDATTVDATTVDATTVDATTVDATTVDALGVPDGRGRPPEANAQPEVDVLKMLEATDMELISRYGRWYIAQRDPRYLRRNALLVLGNSGHGRSPAVERALRVYLAHSDEMLRAHAVWAAARLGRRDLIAATEPALAADPSPLVQDELSRLAAVVIGGAVAG